MKAFWDNLFYDLRECGLTQEEFALKAGEEIRDGLIRVEDAIMDHEGKKALDLLEELKGAY